MSRAISAATCALLLPTTMVLAATDPGVRPGVSAGGPLAGLGSDANNPNLVSLFNFSKDVFEEVDVVADGLGPTFNLDSCQGCHSQPATGGTAGPIDALGDVALFTLFMQFLAPPAPSATTPGGANSITQGRNQFVNIGCAGCHSPSYATQASTIAALNRKPVNLFSDMLVHNMGSGLADRVTQGLAGGDEFRSAPLWGVGQRIFFLHDGRTSNLLTAIQAHKSAAGSGFQASEANAVIDRFNALADSDRQAILNFLRSL